MRKATPAWRRLRKLAVEVGKPVAKLVVVFAGLAALRLPRARLFRMKKEGVEVAFAVVKV